MSEIALKSIFLQLGQRRSLPARLIPRVPKILIDSASQHESSEYNTSVGTQTSPSIPGPLPSNRVSVATQTSPLHSRSSSLAQPRLSSHSRQSSVDPFDNTLFDDEDDEDMDDDATRVSGMSLSPNGKLNSSMSSNTSRARGSTPNGLKPLLLQPTDQPPSYAHLEAEERYRVRSEYIQRWHPGMPVSQAIPIPLPFTSLFIST